MTSDGDPLELFLQANRVHQDARRELEFSDAFATTRSCTPLNNAAWRRSPRQRASLPIGYVDNSRQRAGRLAARSTSALPH